MGYPVIVLGEGQGGVAVESRNIMNTKVLSSVASPSWKLTLKRQRSILWPISIEKSHVPSVKGLPLDTKTMEKLAGFVGRVHRILEERQLPS
jgi:hypothetical protein